MTPQYAENLRNAVLLMYEKEGRSHESGAHEMRKLMDFDLHDRKALFGATWRIANSASNLAVQVDEPARTTLHSVAFHGYRFCAQTDDKFQPSLRDVEERLSSTRILSLEDVLFALEALLGRGVEPRSPEPLTATQDLEGRTAEASAQASRALPRFEAPSRRAFREEFDSFLEGLEHIDARADGAEQARAVEAYRRLLSRFMSVADKGRTFTEFAPLEEDLRRLEPVLARLRLTENPRELLERAVRARGMAKSLDFRTASADDYQSGRLAWLLSGYWNSVLLGHHWESNLPNAVYDFLGYLGVTQAEIRYSDAEFLLLLRVSFSICRIASADELVPLQFLRADSDDLPTWLRHTVGTVLATAGPGRVPPSRVKDDPRLPSNREDFARALLSLWTSEADRAAAGTLLLEMGAWEPARARRLVEQIFQRDHNAVQIWGEAIEENARAALRVRVVRPNPWPPGGVGSYVTVEREAIASLAADVLRRHYPVLAGDLSLSGHAFRDRRVPTFVCSAEYGPLGLFKVDTSERIEREVDNFAKYAQRLHPRYRAGRCDQSLAVITEPDDEKQFIRGAMTSYVFTEDEAPRTLGDWMLDASPASVAAVCRELFERALKPWYDHATTSTIDVFSEFPIFRPLGVQRLVSDCLEFHGLDLASAGSVGVKSIQWIRATLDYLDGAPVERAVAELAASLQVLRSNRCICHGDLHLDNVLVVGRSGAEYPSIIDFEATHEGWILKDFGRFVAAAVSRTHCWTPEEEDALVRDLPAVLLRAQPPGASSVKVEAVLSAICVAREGVGRAWRLHTTPSARELGIALVASFLPFARYRDTSKESARLSLRLSDVLLESVLERG